MAGISALILALLATGGFLAFISWPAERRLKAGGFPGTVDLQLSWRREKLRAIVGRWRDDGPERLQLARRSLMVDFGFIPVYVTALLLASRFGPTGGAFPLLYPVALIAGLADAAENVFQLRMLKEERAARLAPVSFACSAVKWVGLGLCVVVSLAGRV